VGIEDSIYGLGSSRTSNVCLDSSVGSTYEMQMHTECYQVLLNLSTPSLNQLVLQNLREKKKQGIRCNMAWARAEQAISAEIDPHKLWDADAHGVLPSLPHSVHTFLYPWQVSLSGSITCLIRYICCPSQNIRSLGHVLDMLDSIWHENSPKVQII
jgi:hypothetical protein